MKNKYQAIYEKLAKQNGVTPQQVREDMAQAIRLAYELIEFQNIVRSLEKMANA